MLVEAGAAELVLQALRSRPVRIACTATVSSSGDALADQALGQLAGAGGDHELVAVA